MAGETLTAHNDRAAVLARLTAPEGPFALRDEHDGHLPPLRVHAHLPDNLGALLRQALTVADREFLIFEDERISYGAFVARVTALARFLAGPCGVAPGDRVGLCMRNYPEWPIGFFACQAIGAVAVTLNAWWTGAELVYGLTDSGARWALIDGERLTRLAPVRDAIPEVNFVVARHDGPLDRDVAWQAALNQVADTTATVSEALQRVLAAGSVGHGDLATIMYTSGTTGFPKGALHTHRNHLTNIRNTALSAAVARVQMGLPAVADAALTAQSTTLQTFPLFHIGGLSGLYITLVNGGRLVLMYKWDVEQALDLIEREQVGGMSAVPTLVRQLLEHPRARAGALASVAGITSGGAPVPPDLIRQIGDQFSARVAPGNGYGATETTSAVIVNSGADYLARPDSVGRPVATAMVRMVDDVGAICAPGVVGELEVRGPNVFAGYWNKPAETAAAFHEGWFCTGDLGYVDADGFHHVIDRKKDVIIRGGENVYCAEVEGVLHAHPDIIDVALIGLPHRSLGEEVAAVIEVRPGAALTVDHVQAHVADRLARFNAPTRVFFVTEPMPRTATGKILKRELKTRYAEQ